MAPIAWDELTPFRYTTCRDACLHGPFGRMPSNPFPIGRTDTPTCVWSASNDLAAPGSSLLVVQGRAEEFRPSQLNRVRTALEVGDEKLHARHSQ
jgi:hypothetical protein